MNVKDSGLGRDKGDETRFRHDRDRNIGYAYEQEWHQYKPLLFNREANPDYSIVGNYRGGTAFLLGGGPSFAKLDKEPLKRCFTMSMNNSIKTFKTDAWCCVDDPSRFILGCWFDPKIMKFAPYDAAEKPLWDSRNIDGKQMWGPLDKKVGDCPNVRYFRRNGKFHAPRWLWESTLNWGCHKNYGGCRSVMLPSIRILWILGFRKIYLIGVDLDMKPDARYHFSDGRSHEGVKGNSNTYDRMINEYFPTLKKEFEKYGMKIFNCNKDSNLKVFDHVPYEDAIKETLYQFGDPEKEMTEGMYRPYNEKIQALGPDLKKIQDNGRL